MLTFCKTNNSALSSQVQTIYEKIRLDTWTPIRFGLTQDSRIGYKAYIFYAYFSSNCKYLNLCAECEGRPREEIVHEGHDSTHLFVKLKNPVDRPAVGHYEPPAEPILGQVNRILN